jgi:hypothetical protein
MTPSQMSISASKMSAYVSFCVNFNFCVSQIHLVWVTICFFFFGSLLHLSAADIVAIGSFIISWNSNDILTNPRAFQIPTDWLFHCFFVGLSSLLQMCTDGYRINMLFFWSRSVIVWLLWQLFHIGGLIESICERQPLLTTKGTRFPHVH